MTATTVRIAKFSNARGKEFEAQAASWARGGLALTKAFGKGWSITHVQSGYALFHGLRSKGAAHAAAERALELGDWTVSRTALEKNRALTNAVKALRAELRDGGFLLP